MSMYVNLSNAARDVFTTVGIGTIGVTLGWNLGKALEKANENRWKQNQAKKLAERAKTENCQEKTPLHLFHQTVEALKTLDCSLLDADANLCNRLKRELVDA